MKFTHLVLDLSSLTSQQLLDNIKIMSDTMALLANGLHHGQHATALNNSFDWLNRHRDQYLQAFAVRPDARKLAPEIFEPPVRTIEGGTGIPGIQGSY